MFLSKRKGVYYLIYQDETGKRISRSTRARSKSEATEFLRKYNEAADAKRRALRKISLEEFLPILVSYTQRIHTPATVRAHQTALRELMRFIGPSCIMNSLTPADCERFLAIKTSEASVWTARKYHLALGAIFERAKTWGHVVENPWRKVKKPKMPVLLPVFLKRDELRTLLAATEDRDLRELIIVAVLTGLRRGELLAMEWDWVDLSRRLLIVKNSERFTTKSKRARVVPLCDDAMTVLVSRYERRNDDGLVFTRQGRPIAADYLTHAFGRLVKRAGLPSKFHLHTLRHYADIRTMPSSHVDFSSLVGSPIAYSA